MATETSSKVMCYIAREKCGCVTGATIDSPENKKYVAKDIGEWVKEGRTVERVDSDYVRDNFSKCPRDIIARYDRSYCKKCEFNI